MAFTKFDYIIDSPAKLSELDLEEVITVLKTINKQVTSVNHNNELGQSAEIKLCELTDCCARFTFSVATAFALLLVNGIAKTSNSDLSELSAINSKHGATSCFILEDYNKPFKQLTEVDYPPVSEVSYLDFKEYSTHQVVLESVGGHVKHLATFRNSDNLEIKAEIDKDMAIELAQHLYSNLVISGLVQGTYIVTDNSRELKNNKVNMLELTDYYRNDKISLDEGFDLLIKEFGAHIH